MKPFDLELAKQGKPVCTRDGWKARIICWDKKGIQPIVALVYLASYNREDTIHCSINGSYREGTEESPLDLFMAPVIREGWIALHTEAGEVTSSKEVYMHQSEAIARHPYDTIVKIEWED